MDDSVDGEPEKPKRSTTSRRKKAVDSDDDSDFEMEEPEKLEDDDDDETEVVATKRSPRKRLRRAAVADDSDDDELLTSVMAPAKKPAPKTPKKEDKKSPTPVPAKQEPRPIKQEVQVREDTLCITLVRSRQCVLTRWHGSQTPKDDDEDLTTPIAKTGAVATKAPAPCAGCLDGLSFVFSGVLANLARDDAVHLVKCCGGSVSNSVSRATKFLVVGDKLEQGGDIASGNKYKEAVAKNVRILKQSEFYNLITERAADKEREELKQQKNALKAATATRPSAKGKQKLNTYVCALVMIIFCCSVS